MTSLEEAEDCPEGFICGNGTNRFDLQKNKCPKGFWCDKKSSSIAD